MITLAAALLAASAAIILLLRGLPLRRARIQTLTGAYS
jgi:hypothetical protein